MSDYRIKVTDTIDFNLNIDDAGVDTNVSYSLPGNFAEYATLSVNGLLTPIKPGLIVVEAKNPAGVLIRRYSIEIVSVATAALEASVGSSETPLTVEIASPTDPVVQPSATIAGVPADNSVVPPLAPGVPSFDLTANTVSWTAADGATGYDYQLNTAGTAGSSWSSTANTSVGYDPVPYEGSTLHAFVRGKNSGGTSPVVSNSASIPMGQKFTVTRFAVEEGINSHFLPFTEEDIKTIIACAQYSTWGMMPFDHYMDWVVHGKNLALEVIAKSSTNNTYFGVPAKLKGLSSTTTWTADTASKTWLLQFIGFCAGWGWKIKHPVLSDWTKLYKWPTWDYFHKATQVWWGGDYRSFSVVNNGLYEFQFDANDDPGAFPKKLRITSDEWAASQKLGNTHPWYQNIDANLFAVFGDRLDNNGSSGRDLIVRKEFEGAPSGFGNSLGVYINEILLQNETVIPAAASQPVYLYAKGSGLGNTSVSWDLGAGGAYLTTPIKIYGYHETDSYSTMFNNNAGATVTGRLRNTALSTSNSSSPNRIYVRMGFVPISLANAKYRVSIGQADYARQEAVSSSRELVTRHILALHSSSSSFSLNSMNGSYYYTYNETLSDPNCIPQNLEHARCYSTLANLAFSGATYTPSTIPVTSGTATVYNQYGSLVGVHPYKSVLGLPIDTNEVQEANNYMINGFLGDQYSIIVSG